MIWCEVELLLEGDWIVMRMGVLDWRVSMRLKGSLGCT